MRRERENRRLERKIKNEGAKKMKRKRMKKRRECE